MPCVSGTGGGGGVNIHLGRTLTPSRENEPRSRSVMRTLRVAPSSRDISRNQPSVLGAAVSTHSTGV